MVKNDSYRLPSLTELVRGGGNFWRPLFSTARESEIRRDDDPGTMAMRGMVHMLTRRDPLALMHERLASGEQVLYKDYSMRILEMTVLGQLIKESRENPERLSMLTGGMDSTALKRAGEELGYYQTAEAADTDRTDDETGRTAAAVRLIASRMREVLKKITGIAPETFLPHRHILYAEAFCRYCRAKLDAAFPPAATASVL